MDPSEKRQNFNQLPTHTNGKTHLPQPRGHFSVGFVDIMTSGDLKESVLSRIYYPTKEQCLDNDEKWPLWADDNYINGFLSFLKAVASRWPSWAPQDEYLYFGKLRHFSKFIPNNGFATMVRMINGSVYAPLIENANIYDVDNGDKWPVVVFSHGLGCSRFAYSQICADIASYGFVVISPEHRDGSSCLSFYKDNDDVKFIEHRRVEWTEDEYSLRNSQVHHRADECKRSLDLAFDLNDGKNIDNRWKTDANLSAFVGQFDLQRPVICGHSFGGATTLLTLAQDSRFDVAIVMDGWLFPIRDESLADKMADKPVMFVNTESFLNEENLEKMATFADDAFGERICHFIKGSVHQNHVDTTFLVRGAGIRKILGLHSQTCPEVVMGLNNKVVVQFMRKHLHLPKEADLDADVKKLEHLLEPGFGTHVLKIKNSSS